jgi:hypothetical protein
MASKNKRAERNICIEKPPDPFVPSRPELVTPAEGFRCVYNCFRILVDRNLRIACGVSTGFALPATSISEISINRIRGVETLNPLDATSQSDYPSDNPRGQ